LASSTTARNQRTILGQAGLLPHEKVAVPAGLDIEEDRVEQDGNDADEFELDPRVNRSRRGESIVRQNQRDGRHREQHAEIGVGAGDLDVLLAIAQPADEDADADQAIADDHHHRKHGVARQRRHRFFAEHQCCDQRDLDDGDRKRQEQRAIGLADPVRDHLRMMHGGKHRAEQDHQQDDREHDSAWRRREAIARRGHGREQQHRESGK
jgi:hypothetical protein